ncbi:MAG TPA: hypothetical protein VKB59_01545 [Micromonosporaceae bacterium]|nr:hypothetical protein [Micromonosporaceae bacterium]
MQTGSPLPPSGPAFDQPAVRQAFRQQTRALRVVAIIAVVLLAVIVTTAVLESSGSTDEFAGVQALSSLGLIASVVATVRLTMRYADIRSALRTHAWRPVDGVCSTYRSRSDAANIVLRDPATGEQAAMRTPSSGRTPRDVRLQLWFAGDLGGSGVVTAAGGGRLCLVSRLRTPADLRRAVRTPEWLDEHNWPRPPQSLRTTYEIFDMETLRRNGYVPPTVSQPS